MRCVLNTFLAAIVLLSFSLSAFADVAVGEAAPNFIIKDTHLKPVVLASYRGKFVVLEWFNVDCPFVKKHYGSGNMQRLQKTYTDKGVMWFSICSSAPGKQGFYSAEEINKTMAQKGSQATAVILDTRGEVGRLYGAQTTPHIFIIDPEGILIYQGAIDSIPSTDPADIANAQNYAASALDSAMADQPVSVSSTKSYGCSVKY